MNGAIVAIWPIALLIAAAIVGVPLWMTLRHWQASPDYREARAHYRARQAAPGIPRAVTTCPPSRSRAWTGSPSCARPGPRTTALPCLPSGTGRSRSPRMTRDWSRSRSL